MIRGSLKYSLKTYRLDQLWFPFAFLFLFSVIAFLMQDKIVNIFRAYVGCAVPLVGGILAAYCILDDPALELRFSTPVPAWKTLSERLGFIFIIQAVCALVYQLVAGIIGMEFSFFGNWLNLQLSWLVPTLVLMGLGCLFSLIASQPVGGVLIVGVLWLVQIMFRDWFSETRVIRNFFVYMGAFYPDHPSVNANHICLLLFSLFAILASWMLLKRQERYI